MTDLHPLITVAALNMAAAMSPGPAFVLVTNTAASSRRDVALSTAAGTALASVTWAVAAVLGLQLVLAKAAAAYRTFEIFGGFYLGYVGWQFFRHARSPLPQFQAAQTGRAMGFRKGLLLGLSNPKVIVFFGTIFAALFTPQTPVALRWLAVAVVMVNETVWYVTLATAFGAAPVRQTYLRIKAPAERVFGGVLGFFGARLVWTGLRTT